MLAIQGDAPYASPFQWADDQRDGPAARVHVESPGRFVRWVEVRACTPHSTCAAMLKESWKRAHSHEWHDFTPTG